MLDGDDLITQYVMTYVADCSSDNPFQDLGIGERAIFRIADDPEWRADIRGRIKNMFDKYLVPSNLAKLQAVEFNTTADGEVTMAVRYVSIESNEPRSELIPITR